MGATAAPKRPPERDSPSSHGMSAVLPWKVPDGWRRGYASAVARLANSLSPTARRRTIDAALALVVLAITLVQLGSQSFGEKADVARGVDALGVALCLLMALPLLWRRRAPVAVLGIALATSVATVGLDYSVLEPVGPVIALATLADHPRRPDLVRVAIPTLAAFAAFVALAWVRFGPEPGDYLLTALLWSGGWLVIDRRRLTRQRGEREQRLAVAEERSRIARELHDSAGHAINSILIQAGAARTVLATQPQRALEAIASIETIARTTIDDLDGILGRLRREGAAALTPQPGVDRIPELVDRHRADGLDLRLVARVAGERPLPSAVDRAAYRIVQEALTNAARHGSGSADVTIERRDGELRLTVANPVLGRAATRAGGGHGIPGMRERAELLGGRFDAGRDGGRFRVRAALPCAEDGA